MSALLSKQVIFADSCECSSVGLYVHKMVARFTDWPGLVSHFIQAPTGVSARPANTGSDRKALVVIRHLGFTGTHAAFSRHNFCCFHCSSFDRHMILPSTNYERKYIKNGYDSIIGVDEVGMGCLAGPVVVCAAYFNKDFFSRSHKMFLGVRDSKLLSASQRETLAAALLKSGEIKFVIRSCRPITIDRLNIYQASRLAMRRAIKWLSIDNQRPTMILVDGNKTILGLTLPQRAIIKGDRKVFAIACASIVAKVYRDKLMTRYERRFPGYGFRQHKGYGTKRHIAALVRLGPSPIHRRSFSWS